jgi:hypothetical protein
MTIREAQEESRAVYLGGSVGQLVSSAIWFASAALATWGSRNTAVLTLIAGGVFIFPITTLVLRALGRRASLSRENPLGFLAMQVAFTIPLAIPLILAATAYKPEWFYAGCLIVVGAHYLPFITLYGQPIFGLAGMIMASAGILLPRFRPGDFAFGGWLGGAMLAVLGIVLGAAHAARPRIAHSP